jgi:CubicO group peptidase (beta-lactamase class C family)
VAVLAGAATTGHAQRNPIDGLEPYINQALKDWGVAGLSIAIVKDDSVVFAKGFGVRQAGKPEPVTPRTLFAIGSNTKLFTAVATGMLVDAGKMKWDDPASKYLPSFQLYDPYASREIRIRDLLSHRSGLGGADVMWYGTEYDRAEVLRRVRYLEPSSSFRSAYAYQNIMFLAAGEALASAAGMSWDRFIDQRIFEPLGMRTSNTSVNDLPAQPDVATPHQYLDGKAVPIAWRNIDNVAPAGSINSSAIEMAQWLRMLLGDGSYAGRKLLEPARLREITTPQTLMPFEPDTLVPSTHFSLYGLGVAMRDYQGVKVLMHTGGIDGMLSLVAFVPERKVGLVVLTNMTGHNNLYTALMYRVLDSYLGAPARDWSRIFLTLTEAEEKRAATALARRDSARVMGTKPSLALERYAGTYENELYGKVVIALEQGRLVYRYGPMIVDLDHWHYDTFRGKQRSASQLQPPAFYTFRLNTQGKVAELVLMPGAQTFRRASDAL